MVNSAARVARRRSCSWRTRSNQAANIRVTVMTDTACDRVASVTTFAVPARSRHTVAVDAGTFPGLTQRFGAVVESINGQPIVVERSNYYNVVAGQVWSSGGAALASRLTP